LEELKELTGFTVSKATLCRALKKLKLSFIAGFIIIRNNHSVQTSLGHPLQ
jgi:hypothetical protein